MTSGAAVHRRGHANGRKLADEAWRRGPDLKISFTIGYSRNAVVPTGVLDPACI